MSKSWWAYIPIVCEAGVVIDAPTLEQAREFARKALLEAPTDGELRDDDRFYIYELGGLHGAYSLLKETSMTEDNQQEE